MAPRPAKLTRQDLEWEAQARQLMADGYNSAVVARKMIQVHAMPEALAEALVGRLYGKKVSARTGDTTSAVVSGLLTVGAGLGGAALFYRVEGFDYLWHTVVVYLALLGLAGKGLTQVIIALVNADSKEPLP